MAPATEDSNVAQPQIHVLLDEPVVPPEIAAALRRIGAGVRLSQLDSEIRSPSTAPADARLVVTSRTPAGAGRRLDPLYRTWGSSPCATLVLTASPGEAMRARPPSSAQPIGFASGLSADELAGRLTTMCALQQPLNTLRHELAELRQQHVRDAEDVHELDEQLRLASQLQRDLLPDPLPQIHAANLHTVYRPADCVSGDIYDVVRLDESHVALSCADATGHGIPAALLTMFIKRIMRGKEAYQGAYRILPPNEVLESLNREILDADLTHCQFVTGLYAIYEEETRTLSWARGGAPLPILIRPGQPPQQLHSEGMLLGVEPCCRLECAELALESGDVVVFHTDGLDALLLERTHDAPYDALPDTPWYARLATESVTDCLSEITDRVETTPRSEWPVDDLTIMALECL